MSALIDITGQRFGRLTVIERSGSDRTGVFWKCICDCGNYTNVLGVKLRNGHTRSCGCLALEKIGKVNKTYGMSKSRLHYIWGGMKSRCYNPNNPAYSQYGGRGIVVCDEWRNDFTKFVDWAYANGYSDELTIDRIDNDKGYFPENCRWATPKIQANNRRNSRTFIVNGQKKTIAEWCDLFDKKYDVVYYRVKQGWSIEEALELISRKK